MLALYFRLVMTVIYSLSLQFIQLIIHNFKIIYKITSRNPQQCCGDTPPHTTTTPLLITLLTTLLTTLLAHQPLILLITHLYPSSSLLSLTPPPLTPSLISCPCYDFSACFSFMRANVSRDNNVQEEICWTGKEKTLQPNGMFQQLPYISIHRHSQLQGYDSNESFLKTMWSADIQAIPSFYMVILLRSTNLCYRIEAFLVSFSP